MTVLDRLSTGLKAWIILFLLTFGAAAPGVFLLPALDRDESRFAQASKEMLEENNYIVIQYQDELRNKKPAGIHWLQAASTALTTGPEAKEIWTYRVPSWLGAAFGTLACFWAGIALVGRRAAFLGAAMFGATLLLTSEAHISKTDGVLVFLTTLGIGALGRLCLGTDKPGRMAFLVWLTVSASFLIKGPVTMMVVAYAGLGAYVWDRAAGSRTGDWWRPLADWKGPALFVAMVLPWFLWIQAATNGEYIEGAVGKDLKDKFTGASEGHAGWFLYHLSHIPAWFFPATLLFVAGLVASVKQVAGAGGINTAPVRRYAFAGAALLAILTALNYGLALVPPFAVGQRCGNPPYTEAAGGLAVPVHCSGLVHGARRAGRRAALERGEGSAPAARLGAADLCLLRADADAAQPLYPSCLSGLRSPLRLCRRAADGRRQNAGVQHRGHGAFRDRCAACCWRRPSRA